MRKIEKEMIAAVKAGKNWRKDNTEVVSTEGAHWPAKEIKVYLHGHKIAEVCRNSGIVFPDMSTLRAWPTATTKSRLRALGVNLTQKKGKIYIDDEYICTV